MSFIVVYFGKIYYDYLLYVSEKSLSPYIGIIAVKVLWLPLWIIPDNGQNKKKKT
jgi:hypothetical protein